MHCFLILSYIDLENKKKILSILIEKLKEVLERKIDVESCGQVVAKRKSNILQENVGELLCITDNSGRNLFDCMIDKGEYSLYEKYYSEQLSSKWKKNLQKSL